MAARTVIGLSQDRNSLPPGALDLGLAAPESGDPALVVHRRRSDHAARTAEPAAAAAAVARQAPLARRTRASRAAHGAARALLRIRREAVLQRGRCARGSGRRAACGIHAALAALRAALRER